MPREEARYVLLSVLKTIKSKRKPTIVLDAGEDLLADEVTSLLSLAKYVAEEKSLAEIVLVFSASAVSMDQLDVI